MNVNEDQILKEQATTGQDENAEIAEVRRILRECAFKEDVIDGVINQLGASSVSELKGLDYESLVEVGVKKLPAKAMIERLQQYLGIGEDQREEKTVGQDVVEKEDPGEKLLPEIIIGEAWLSSIERPSILNLGINQYIAAIQAAIADRFDLFSVPDKVCDAMLDYSYETDTVLGDNYYNIRNIITRREYGDLFSAIDLHSSDIAKPRRKELIRRINEFLFPLVPQAIQELNAWYDRWAKMSGPQLVLALEKMNNHSVRQRNISSFPETSVLLSFSDKIVRALNKSLAGTGGVAAYAMAAEATNIRKCLDDTTLPSLVGTLNKEQMLVKLEIDLDPAVIRMEKAIVQFIAAFAQANELTSHENAGYYFLELYQLGCEITCWDNLAKRESAILASGRKSNKSNKEVAAAEEVKVIETKAIGQLDGAKTVVGPESTGLPVGVRDQRL